MDALLTQARAALQRGDDAAALELTTQILAAEPTDAQALLARSLANYRLNDLAQAEADLSAALASSEAGGDSASADMRWPEDFLAWVSTVRAVYAPHIELPDISLDDLNVAAPAAAVSAHFVMNVEIVRIPVIVERNIVGAFLGGLTAPDFGVVDGTGLPQPIRELIPENDPTSIGILVDAGAGTADKTDAIRNAVSRLLEALQPEDEVFIAQYSDSAEFLSDFSTDRVALAAALSGYTPSAGRAMHDAIAMGLIRMRSAKFEKKALIVIADGDDAGSRTTEDEILVAARREGVAVHALLMVPGAKRWRPTFVPTEDPTLTGEAAAEAEATAEPAPEPLPEGNAGLLQEISHNTGGLVALRPAAEARFGGFAGWLELACSDLSDYINNQYLLLFRSTDPPERGVWRELRVSVTPKHEKIRARSGYVR